jgi:hypothetical protein
VTRSPDCSARRCAGCPASLIPTRSWSWASGRGAHQLTRPSTCINAGTNTIRTSVASTSTATVKPTPIILLIVNAISASSLLPRWPAIARDGCAHDEGQHMSAGSPVIGAKPPRYAAVLLIRW